MKCLNKWMCGALIGSSLFLSSCEEAVETPTGSLNVNKTSILENDTVWFDYTGDADMIVFYSGELGNNYAFKNRTEAKVGDMKLSFATFHRYGTAETAEVELLYSTDYLGDGHPENATWTSLSDQAAWADPTTGSQLPKDATPSGDIDLSSFNKNTYFAFKYHGITDGSVVVQKSWHLMDFKISGVLEGGIPLNILHCDFITAGEYSIVDQDKSKDVKDKITKWTLQKATGAYGPSIKMGAKSTSENIDWLIFDPVDFSQDTKPVDPDKGKPVKGSNESNKPFFHVYKKAGTYTATALASVWDYKDGQVKQVLLEKTIEVQPRPEIEE